MVTVKKSSVKTFSSIDRPPFIKWEAGMTLEGIVTACYEGMGSDPIVEARKRDGTLVRFNASKAGIRYALERAGTEFQVNDDFTLYARQGMTEHYGRASLHFDLTLSRPEQ